MTGSQPGHELLHTLGSLWKHTRCLREDIVDFQNRKLRHIIRYAYENVEHYRNLFDREGIKPGDIRTREDLNIIPITEKKDLRRCGPEGFLARGTNKARLMPWVTSGSSGRPFTIYRSPLEDNVINMFRVRAYRDQYGIRFRDRTAQVLAGSFGGEKRKTLLSSLRQSMGLYRKYLVRCLRPPETICRELLMLNPDVITGYAGTLAHIAPLIEGRFSDKNLRLVFPSGESLPGFKRKAIERGFGKRVFDLFSLHECNILANECPDTGAYHVCDDNVAVEILKDGQPAEEGESGEVILTALHSYTMPLIRYRSGDVVVKGSETCPCGRPFSVFKTVKGRVRDFFFLPDGRHVHPLEIIVPVFEDSVTWIDQFKMIQESQSGFILRVVPKHMPTEEEKKYLCKMISKRIGAGGHLKIDFVDHIDFEPSGKFKDCENLMNKEDQ